MTRDEEVLALLREACTATRREARCSDQPTRGYLDDACDQMGQAIALLEAPQPAAAPSDASWDGQAQLRAEMKATRKRVRELESAAALTASEPTGAVDVAGALAELNAAVRNGAIAESWDHILRAVAKLRGGTP